MTLTVILAFGFVLPICMLILSIYRDRRRAEQAEEREIAEIMHRAEMEKRAEARRRQEAEHKAALRRQENEARLAAEAAGQARKQATKAAEQAQKQAEKEQHEAARKAAAEAKHQDMMRRREELHQQKMRQLAELQAAQAELQATQVATRAAIEKAHIEEARKAALGAETIKKTKERLPIAVPRETTIQSHHNIDPSSWPWTSLDSGRLERAAQLNGNIITWDPTPKAEFVSRSTAEVYSTTLTSCTCYDFAIRSHGKSPCKHILALAIQTGIILPDGTPKTAQNSVEESDTSSDANTKEVLPLAENPASPNEQVPPSLSGLHISFTGSMKYMSQRELESYIRSHGGSASVRLTSSANLLVLGKEPSAKTVVAASEHNVKLIIEEDFYQKYNIPTRKAKKAKREDHDVAPVQSEAIQQEAGDELELLLDKLKTRSIAFVDKRSVGGCLWVASTPETDEVLSTSKFNGRSFNKAVKTSHFNSSSGWYIS